MLLTLFWSGREPWFKWPTPSLGTEWPWGVPTERVGGRGVCTKVHALYLHGLWGHIYAIGLPHVPSFPTLCSESMYKAWSWFNWEKERERREEGGKRGRERDKEKREVSHKIEWKAQARHSHQRSPPVVPNGNSGAYHLGFQKSPCQLREWWVKWNYMCTSHSINPLLCQPVL